MSKRNTSVEYYEQLWAGLKIVRGMGEIEGCARSIVAGEDKYKAVEAKTTVPWYVIGAIHGMECGFNWSQCLHNGEPWNRKTTLVPAGRGPFSSWEEAAVDALMMKQPLFPAVWNVAEMSYFLEQYNGMGYANKGVNSPYLYSDTSAGVGVGKYVSDGHYDPNAVSDQPGALAMLKLLSDQGKIRIPVAPSAIYYSKIKSDAFARYQEFLAASLGSKVSIVADGKIGPRTSEAHRLLFGEYLFGDPRRNA